MEKLSGFYLVFRCESRSIVRFCAVNHRTLRKHYEKKCAECFFSEGDVKPLEPGTRAIIRLILPGGRLLFETTYPKLSRPQRFRLSD